MIESFSFFITLAAIGTALVGAALSVWLSFTRGRAVRELKRRLADTYDVQEKDFEELLEAFRKLEVEARGRSIKAEMLHAYPFNSGWHLRRFGEHPVWSGRIDEAAHRQRRFFDGAFDDTGGYASDAVGLAAIVTENELVEIGLKVLRLYCACMRAEQPALHKRDRPMA